MLEACFFVGKCFSLEYSKERGGAGELLDRLPPDLLEGATSLVSGMKSPSSRPELFHLHGLKERGESVRGGGGILDFTLSSTRTMLGASSFRESSAKYS